MQCLGAYLILDDLLVNIGLPGPRIKSSLFVLDPAGLRGSARLIAIKLVPKDKMGTYAQCNTGAGDIA